MPPAIPVISSMVMSLGWNPDTGRLIAQFSEDVWYEYDNVPADVAARVIFNKSVGGTFTALVKKGEFKFRRVTTAVALSDEGRWHGTTEQQTGQAPQEG